MSHKLPNYLKTYRKCAGLSQDEIAFLLGCKSGTKISRYEHFKRQPSINTVFKYSVIFKTPPEELFSGIYQETESEIFKRVKLLIKKLDSDEPDKKTIAKIEFLRAILERSDKNL
ncbi:MAG: helix-turn-helix transcriptional regulator [Nitrospirota bacterium]